MIEALESRISPATITGKVLTYTDVDGDSVTIKFATRGVLTSANAFFDTAFDSTGPQQLQFISFVGQTFAGTSITMTVQQAGGGNGTADVGYIIGTGIDLGQIKLTGDLGGITAGDQDAAPGIVKLSVGSLGAKGNTTQGNVGHTHSAITGPLGSLAVSGDFKEASLDVFDIMVSGVAKTGSGRIGKITIGGSLIGGVEDNSGRITTASGDIGKTTIGGDIVGGDGTSSGQIQAGKGLKGLTVGTMDPGGAITGGSILGGNGSFSGSVFCNGAMGKVTILGDLQGGMGEESGNLDSESSIVSVTIKGSLIGGGNFDSGTIDAETNVKFIVVEKDVKGGLQDEAGLIDIDGNLAMVRVGGSIIGGGAVDSGQSGISCDGKLGIVSIGADLIGGAGEQSGSIFSDGGIVKLTIGHDILGGGGEQSGTVHSDGKIGTAIIGRDIRGGGGTDSGEVDSDSHIANVSIGRDLAGGSGLFSGVVYADGNIGTVQIGRDVLGGSGQDSGEVFAGFIDDTRGNVKKILVGGSLLGGSGSFSGFLGAAGNVGLIQIASSVLGGSGIESAEIYSGTGLKSVVIQGSLLAGSGLRSATIASDQTIGSVVVEGNITGTTDHHVIIGARGQAKQGATTDVAIRSIRVDGSMEFVDILAGYLSPAFGSLDPFSPVNPDAQIGTIKVGQDLLSTNIVAGVRDVLLDGFGNGDDLLISGDTADRIIASIARIEVGGLVNGTADVDLEYGITAQWVKAMIIGGTPVSLTGGPNNDSLLAIPGATTGDYRINEVG